MPDGTQTTPVTDENDAETPSKSSITVHHLDREKCDSDRAYADKIGDVNRDRWALTQDIFNAVYTPVETILDEDNIENGFKRSQGFVVNEECNARHGVRSSQVHDVLELIHPDGESEFYIIDAMGFTETDLEITE